MGCSLLEKSEITFFLNIYCASRNVFADSQHQSDRDDSVNASEVLQTDCSFIRVNIGN